MPRRSDLARFMALTCFGCASQAAPVAPSETPARAPTVTPAPVPMATSIPVATQRADSSPLAATPPEPTVALEVPEFLPAIVRLPDGDAKAPVLIVAHGAGGTPEVHCELWARITQGKPVLLCIRGRARGPNVADGDYYPDHPALERETFAALAALRARFPSRIADGPVFYAGFSQGATMGSLMLVEHASEVTRLALVEGGFSDWNMARARAFRAGGGERVLFVCGRKECAEPARSAAHWFSEAGVAAEVEYIQGAGHSHDARVEARIAAAYPWFVAGDARWSSDDAHASQRAYTQTTGTPSKVPTSAGASLP